MSHSSAAEVSTRFQVKLYFLLIRFTRLTTLLLAANGMSSWNKARIRCKRMCLPLDYPD